MKIISDYVLDIIFLSNKNHSLQHQLTYLPDGAYKTKSKI